MKKALIFDRYLDTLGGGERYSLEFALALAQNGFEVEIAWRGTKELDHARERFGLDTSPLNVNPKAYSIFFTRSGIYDRFRFTRNYDLIFWLSDGSLPLLFSKKTLIHFQDPFTHLGGGFINRLIKSTFYHQIIYNSVFTQKVIEKQLPFSRGQVIYPPIAIDQFKPGKKENLILSVARFDSPSHAKRQDIILQAFSLFHATNPHFKLILAGGVMGEGGNSYLKVLQENVGELPIEFIPNPSFTQLKNLYSRANFFWHTAGYDIDEKSNPEKTEHFGITTVEAMSAGCVPVVINRGGQKEIIREGEGFLCETIEDIAKRTLSLIENQSLLKSYSTKARLRAEAFSSTTFYTKVAQVVA